MRYADHLPAVRSKPGQHPLLQLCEGGDVEIDIVVKQPDAAADDRPSVEERQKSESDARRKIVFIGEVIAVVTNALLKREPPVHRPLVFEVRKKFGLVTAELATAKEVELLAACAVGSHYSHRVTRVAPVVSDVAYSGTNLHEVRTRKIRRVE